MNTNKSVTDKELWHVGVFSVPQIIKGEGRDNSIDNNNNKTKAQTHVDSDSHQEKIATKPSFP